MSSTTSNPSLTLILHSMHCVANTASLFLDSLTMVSWSHISHSATLLLMWIISTLLMVNFLFICALVSPSAYFLITSFFSGVSFWDQLILELFHFLQYTSPVQDHKAQHCLSLPWHPTMHLEHYYLVGSCCAFIQHCCRLCNAEKWSR